MPSITIKAIPITASIAGIKKFFRRFFTVDFCHASIGQTAITNIIDNRIGASTLLKNDIPTVTFVPRTASDTSGKTVPQKVANAAPTNNKLLTKKLLSLETIELNSPALLLSKLYRLINT